MHEGYSTESEILGSRRHRWPRGPGANAHVGKCGERRLIVVISPLPEERHFSTGLSRRPNCAIPVDAGPFARGREEAGHQ
jgi:hypothetical protein